MLRAAADAVRRERRGAPRMEVVWTGPRASTSFLRATRQVVLDVLQGAASELLVVGCWISAKGSSDIVSQIVSDIAGARLDVTGR